MNPESSSPVPTDETRRTFIKKGAPAAAAALIGGPLFRDTARAQTPVTAPTRDHSGQAAETITIGMIGTGNRGRSNLRAILSSAISGNVKVGAVCDLWDKRAELARELAELSAERVFLDYRKLLELPDLDAVVISTSDQWHARIAIDAMNAGKHVYLEKPFTRYMGEAFEVYDTAKRTGLAFQLGTQGVSHPAWARCAEIVRSGGIGPVVLAQAAYMRNSGARGEWNYRIDPGFTRDSLDWKTWLGPVAEREFNPEHYFRWRKFYPYCAGITGDLIPHRLSPILLATATTEFPSRVVCLGTRKIQTDRDVNDNVQIVAEFPSGIAVHILGSTVNEQGVPNVIRGHHATLSIDGTKIGMQPETPFAAKIDAQVFETEDVNTAQAHFQNWYFCIREGGEPVAGPELAIRQQTILSLAEMSERMNIMCLFDEKTRRITTGEGRVVEPITYGTLPVS